MTLQGVVQNSNDMTDEDMISFASKIATIK